MAQINRNDTIRIVLLGKTGAGKSSTGNTILGRKAFGVKCSPESFTDKCEAHDGCVDGQKITVIDTPGLYDTSMEEGELKCRIEQLFNYSGDGIHAILLVINLRSKFTEEERNTVQWIKTNFGEEASKNTIVLFTNGDALENNHMPITEYINAGEELQNLVKLCNGRYQVFNNLMIRSNDKDSPVNKLLGKIRTMTEKNNLYTKKKYEETQGKLFANVVGAGAGGVIGAGVAGGIAVKVGAAKGTVIAFTVLGGVGVAAVVGVVGLGAVIYLKYFKHESSNESENKED